jgi:hypothetical protein
MVLTDFSFARNLISLTPRRLIQVTASKCDLLKLIYIVRMLHFDCSIASACPTQYSIPATVPPHAHSPHIAQVIKVRVLKSRFTSMWHWAH